MAASPAEVIRPLRRVEYDRLVALGVFQDERIELLDGALYEMSPIGIPHDFAVQELTELLILALHGRAKVRPQMSFAASELSQPEPDLTITPLVSWDSEQANQALLIIEFLHGFGAAWHVSVVFANGPANPHVGIAALAVRRNFRVARHADGW